MTDKKADDPVTRVARAIGEQLGYDYDKLPWAGFTYQYDRRTLRRLARAAIRAYKRGNTQ